MCGFVCYGSAERVLARRSRGAGQGRRPQPIGGYAGGGQETLAQRSTDSWLSTLRTAVAHHVTHDRAIEALDAARDEPSTRNG